MTHELIGREAGVPSPEQTLDQLANSAYETSTLAQDIKGSASWIEEYAGSQIYQAHLDYENASRNPNGMQAQQTAARFLHEAANYFTHPNGPADWWGEKFGSETSSKASELGNNFHAYQTAETDPRYDATKTEMSEKLDDTLKLLNSNVGSQLSSSITEWADMVRNDPGTLVGGKWQEHLKKMVGSANATKEWGEEVMTSTYDLGTAITMRDTISDTLTKSTDTLVTHDLNPVTNKYQQVLVPTVSSDRGDPYLRK